MNENQCQEGWRGVQLGSDVKWGGVLRTRIWLFADSERLA